MHKEIPQLIQEGILTPIQDLAMQTDEKDDFDKGFVFKHGALDIRGSQMQKYLGSISNKAYPIPFGYINCHATF